jgi:hypothetical protein
MVRDAMPDTLLLQELDDADASEVIERAAHPAIQVRRR